MHVQDWEVGHKTTQRGMEARRRSRTPELCSLPKPGRREVQAEGCLARLPSIKPTEISVSLYFSRIPMS